MAMVSGTNSCIRNVAVRKLKTKLMDMINELSSHLPTNSLDHLIDGLGGPNYVAEVGMGMKFVGLISLSGQDPVVGARDDMSLLARFCSLP